MSDQPAVSVVIPTYNRADLLPEALDSVLGQEWPELETVVVDDGSSDSTPALLEDYRRRFPTMIRVIRQENQGVSAARNAGIEVARFDLLAFLDSDNRWLPGKLPRQIATLTADSSLALNFTAYRNVVGETRQEVVLEGWVAEPGSTIERLLAGCCINTSTVVARRSVLRAVGMFAADLRCCEDHDLWLRIAAAGHRIGYLPEVLLDYRIHGGSVSADRVRVSVNTERVIERLFDRQLLPPPFQARRRYYLARCYLNSACRYLEAGKGRLSRQALVRALRTHPLSVRPGWLRLWAQAGRSPA